MNLHHWSWILPLIFSVGLTVHTRVRFRNAKANGTLTAAEALKAKITPDELAEAAMIFFLLWRISSLVLLAWLLWALS